MTEVIVKRAYVRKVKHDGVYWVVSERKLLTTTPLFVFENRAAAYASLQTLQDKSGSLLARFKVDRVDLAE